VLMESLAGSGHFFAAKRLRLADKLELFRLDPWGRTLFPALSVFSVVLVGTVSIGYFNVSAMSQMPPRQQARLIAID